MRKPSLLLIAAAFLLAGGLLYGSYLESDYPAEAPPQPPMPIIRPEPPPRPVPDNPLAWLVRRLTVREGYHYGGLTVFLVEVSGVSDRTPYLSVQEAVASGVLTVQEKGAGTVPALTVENKGREPILMLGGEMLLGGKQNRILREDVLLPAHSGPVEVPVLCIEQGRWTDRPLGFKGGEPLAPLAVRGSAQALRPQDEVWEGVRSYQRDLAVESATGDLQAVHDSPEVRKALQDYRERFAEHCWRPAAVGMVVARYGRIVGADLFCNPALFAKHRDRLLDSYAVDCIAWRGRAVNAEDRIAPRHLGGAEEFLRRLLRAEYGWRETPGAGRLLTVAGAGVNGSALVYRDNVLHACVFPELEVIIRRPRPVPPPEPIPLPWPMPGPREE